MTYARKLAGVLVLLIAGSAVPAARAAPFAYIANSNGNNVSVIDIATNAVVATVPVGTFPYGVGVSPTGTRVFVGNNFSNNVSVIDTASNTVIATVPVGPAPYGVAVNPAGTRAYVANGNGNSVSVIDTASNTVIATVGVSTGPFGVAVNPAGTRVYVVNRGSNFSTPRISVIDTATNTVVGTIGSLGGTPQGIAINAAGTRAYVTNSAFTSSSVSVIDLATETVVGTVAVGGTPLGVAVNPAGTRVYVTNNGSNNVSVIDTASNTVIATVPVGGLPYGVAVTPDGTRAYVATFAGNDVEVINTSTNGIAAFIGAGNRPIAFGLFIGGPSAPTGPTISAIRPGSGGSAGGSSVVIDGTNLATVSSVTFGGVTARIDAATATSLVVAAPGGSAGTVDIVVTNAGGPATVANAFTYVNDDDVARDFAFANPSPRWSYGWELARGATFTPYAARSVNGGLDLWNSTLPLVWHNATAGTINSATNSTPPGKFGLHPGLFGENSVVRWTAPSSGTYRVAGAFTGLDYSYPTTTDVAILKNNNATTPLFSGNIASYNVALNFSVDVPVAAGDTIEFTVGTGGNGYQGDATGLDAVITPLTAAPSITLTPSALTFASRTVMTTSSPQTVTLANNGPGPLAIASITASGDFAFTSACPATLAAAATCTIDVTFTPLTTGVRSGSLAFTTDASGSPHSVSLSGTGQSTPTAVIEVTPSALDFAPQGIGSEGAVQIVSVANVGNATLFFGPIATTGDYARRPVPPAAPGAPPRPPNYDGECNIGLAPGSVCYLAVAFLPTAELTRHGVLNIASNASPASVRLIGTGFVSVPPRFLGVPESVLFAPQPVGTRSAGQAVAIANNSASAVAISELSVSGDFAVSDTCATVPARGMCTLLVTFRPSAEGDRVGRLTLRSLAETEPYEVSLTGAGVFNPVPALEVSVARAGFGNTLIGTIPALEARLANIGEVPVALGPISTTGDFLVSHSCGAVLAVGASCPVQVRFFPRMLGAQVGSLEVISNAAGSPHLVQFSGTGCSIPSVGRSRLRPVLCSP